MLDSINKFIDELPLGIEPQGLYAPIRYVMSLGGKRIRPLLMQLSYGLWREDEDSILSQAVGLEMYHNFTLLHDDVMDNADMRRGMPTVHKRWDVNTAILSGDNMLCMAFQMMRDTSRNARLRDCIDEAYDCFVRTTIEINHGQQYDVDFESRPDVSEAEYIEMIRLKTSVLLACAMKIGAVLAGAPKEDVESVYRFGEALGLAFQLQDDYLDVYGDPKVFGKAIGGDIMENKKTYMLINAIRRAEGADREELLHWIGSRDFDRQEKVAAVTALYDRLGIDRMAKDKMSEYYDIAVRALDKVNVAEERKKALRAFAEKVNQREK